ncbi:Hypothetical predicted protein, partial [Paramuricea clavata]
MDELTKKKRIRAGHRDKRKLTNYNSEGETDKNALKQLRDTLKDKIEALKNLDATIIELLSDSKDEDAEEELAKEIEESDDIIADMQKVILDISDVINEAIVQSATVTDDTTLNSSLSSETKKIICAKLPKLEVKKFGGKLQEWQEFWDSFDSAVNQNEGLADVDKFAYLRSLLIEPARSAISGFALTSANYNEAIDLLKRRYGKKNAIQKAHIQELMNMKPVCNDRDTEKLRKLYDTCETNYRGLKALGVDETAHSTIVVPEILEKLPESFRLTITRDTNFSEWSMTEVMDAFLKEIELREAHKPNDRKTREPRKAKEYIYGHAGGSAAALFTRQGHGNYGRIKCAYCLGEHSHENCKKITDINERKQLIRKSVCEGTGVPTDYVQSNHSILGSQSRVALLTAQALVKGVKGSPRVRVLFDTGSHKSFVSRKVVKAAGVPAKRKEWIEIKSFGQERAEGKLQDVFELEVLPVTGGESVNIEAYGVEYVSQIRNEHVELKKRDYSHLQGLWFSDVCKENEVLEIEVLIGADYLWCFQEGNVVRGKADEPVAVQTRLGWVLSGPMKVSGSGNETNSMHVVDVNFLVQDNSSCTKLDESIHRLWDFETLGIRQEDEVHESLKDSIKFNGTRCSVKLPWKEGHSALPSNYNISLKRLK